MPLQKQSIPINFGKGLDLKTDPFQLAPGNFLALNNMVFDTLGRLTKRNGNTNITSLPDTLQTTLTTLNDNLLATGQNLYAFDEDSNEWLNKGVVQPVSLRIESLVRNSSNQDSGDLAVAESGLGCLVYTDTPNTSHYIIFNTRTGQQIINQTDLPAAARSPRVFLLGRYFIITFLSTVSASPHLQYLAIPTASPSTPGIATDLSTTVESTATGYDAFVSNNSLYFSWTATSTTIDIATLSSTLIISAPVVITGHRADVMAVTADESASTSVIYVGFGDKTAQTGYVAAFTQSLIPILAPTQIYNSLVVNAITLVANSGVAQAFYEVELVYSAPNPAERQNYVQTVQVVQAGGVGGTTTVLRGGIELASKAFIDATNDTTYVLVHLDSENQGLLLLVDSEGNIFMKLDYGNASGQFHGTLPSVTIIDNEYYVPYVTTSLLVPANKNVNPAGTSAHGVFTQAGMNMVVFAINTSGQYSSDIAGALYLTGGQLWEYDGVKPVEAGFHVYPGLTAFTTVDTGGDITKQLYNYVFTFEWTNNSGNIERSAPSIPLVVDISASATDTNVNTLYVPNLHLTAKTGTNPVRIVGYRWSTAQEIFYQFTSILDPIINDPDTDFVMITDDLADEDILGNPILYTTGGVVENIGAPASVASVLFKNRLFLIDAEDQNLLWFSKQVIEDTPIEMSDLLTIYVAPTTGAQQSTGPMTALGAMDDKLIMFKKDAAYYLTGTGPDNTGAQNDFSDPTYITSSVGCANPNSIVLTPNGLMFQSDKGIWILGRDLNTQYIGAAVEKYNNNKVLSASVIPGTNQVRFILDNSITLMYDYFVGQWATFSNIFAISACLYQGKHTYLNNLGKVYQETPGVFTDGSLPVLVSLTTSWMNVAGLQGYERFYFANLLGTYITPFTLNVGISYDYNAGAQQAIRILPDNYNAKWGGLAQWGSGGPWGGVSNVFSARMFPEKQKCESFQLTINEIYDSSFGVPAGQGLTLSGINMVIGVKKGWRTQSAAKSFG